MRDGATVGTDLISNIDENKIIKMMVGREVSELFPKQPAELGDVVLKVENLGQAGQFTGINFEVRKGEIVGLAGLVGSGRSEIVRAIFGIDKYDTGSVFLNGKSLARGSASKAMDAGIAFVPEDRRQQGLLMPYSISTNTAITVLKKLSRAFLIRAKKEKEVAITWGQTLQLKYTSVEDAVEKLSGGNQQKVVLGKWFATNPELLIVDEPTRGIDVGTKSEVHKLLSQKVQQGLAVIMVSSELPEVLGMSDRIIVMREGRQTAILNREDATPEKVIALATGAVSAK
jgi:rhamnose transport system ATP-binding protein